MRVEYSKKFLKSATRLPAQLIVLAERKETLFRLNPFHPSLDTHKLHGKDADAWAFSINRKIRIKFVFVANDSLLFLDIGTHDIYE